MLYPLQKSLKRVADNAVHFTLWLMFAWSSHARIDRVSWRDDELHFRRVSCQGATTDCMTIMV